MSEIREGILFPQHVQSFLDTSADYLGRRPETGRRTQEEGLRPVPPDPAGRRGLGRGGSNAGTAN